MALDGAKRRQQLTRSNFRVRENSGSQTVPRPPHRPFQDKLCPWLYFEPLL